MKRTFLYIILALLSVYQAGAQDSVAELRNLLFNPSSEHVLVVAHRANWQTAPENSIKAVLNALKIGVDIVEIDVRKTKDGELIVMHDSSIDRMTTGKGVIAELTLDSIKKVFLRNNTGMPTSYKVSTLREMMLAIKGKRILVNIDKAWGDLEQTLKITEETGTTAQIILKGNEPMGKLREQYGTLIDKVIYMPIVWPEDYNLRNKGEKINPYKYTNDFINEYSPKAFEVIVKDEISSIDDAIKLMQNKKISVWINTLWPEICAGHVDYKALDNPDENWGWIIKKGANIIQTDYSEQLLKYLRSKGLHK